MKKIFLILLITSSVCFSQTGWFWQNPYPVSNRMTNCKMLNANTGFVYGWNNTVVKTTNGGTSWSVVMALGNPFVGWEKISFPDNNTGYLAGRTVNDSGKIAKTTDGGSTWNTIFTAYQVPFYDLDFVNVNTGFARGYSYLLPFGYNLLKTTNAGLTWDSISMPSTTVQCAYMDFIDVNTGYLAGSGGKIFKTTNAGLNWIQQVSGTTVNAYSLFFKDANTGYAGYTNFILKTTNGGTTWIQYGGISDLYIYGIQFFDANTGYISGTGKINKTTNGGVNWINVLNTGTSPYYGGLSMTDANTLLCVGNNVGIYQILKTTNGGTNWNNLNNGSIVNLFDIEFTDANTGITVGNSGTIIRTTNAGNVWSIVPGGTSNALYAIEEINPSILIAGGLSGTMIKTTNGGANWSSLTSGSTSSISDITFVNSNTGFYSVYSDKIYKTTNQGSNWTPINIDPNTEFADLVFVDENTGYGIGDTSDGFDSWSYISKTTNGGNSWTNVLGGSYSYLNAGYFINANTGWAAGENGVALKTTNGGINWNYVDVSADSTSISDIQATSPLDIYMICTKGLLKSSNGGNSWICLPTVTPYVSKMIFTDTSNVYVCGNYGTIIKSTFGGGPIGIHQTSSEMPKSFLLGQNYPNPFNPMTNIEFSVPKSSFVSMIIYDLLGREIEKIVSEYLSAGSYKVDWNASGYSSGVYFYKLETESFTETKKMLLVK